MRRLAQLQQPGDHDHHQRAGSNSLDAALLNHLLDLEHMGIAAYTAGIPLLSPAGRKDGQLFLTQELSHAGELAGLVNQAGGKPHKGRETLRLRSSEHRARTC